MKRSVTKPCLVWQVLHALFSLRSTKSHLFKIDFSGYGLSMAKACFYFGIPLFLLSPLGLNQVHAQWIQIGDALDLRYEGQSVAINDKMYVFSGFTSGFQVEAKNEVYDPSTDTWTNFPNMPQPVTHTGVAVVNNNEVWVVGGRKVNNTQIALSQIYNISTQSWSNGPSLPENRAGGGLALVNNKLYYLSGFGDNGLIDEPEVYMLDLANQGAGWSVATNAPFPRNHFATAVLNGKIYMIGGQTEHDFSAQDVTDVDVYDPGTNTWATVAPLPGKNSHFEPGTFIHNGKILCVGGEVVGNAIFEYDPGANTWTQTDTYPVSRLAPSARIVGGKFVISHGGDGVTPTKAVYIKNLGPVTNNLPIITSPGTQNDEPGTSVSLQIVASDPDGDNLVFSQTGLPTGLSINPVSGLISGTLGTTTGANAVTITVTDDGNPVLSASASFTWNVSEAGPPPAVGDPIYRVNAGGINLTGTPIDWEIDKEGTPSPYINSNESNNTTGWDGEFGGTNNTGAPGIMLNTYRWDGPWNDEMKWAFPVTNGSYQVKLYFAENNTPGSRFFDVSIEGVLVLNDYDIVADAGSNVAIVKAFNANVADGTLNIDFDRVPGGDNPMINGIEILTASSNDPPVLTAIADQAFEVGDAVSITAQATDPDGDNITFSALNLPAGLTINGLSGEISGTITEVPGLFASTIIATDDGSPVAADSTGINWTITQPNQAPNVTPIANQTSEQNDNISLQVVAVDPENDDILYAETGLPTGLSINSVTGLISGTITAAIGDYNVSVTATDNGSPSEDSTIAFVWTVIEEQPNIPPVIDPIANQTYEEGAAVSLQANASDADGDNFSFGALNLPAGITINPTSGLISGTLTAAIGTYSSTIIVTDDGTPTIEADSTDFDWNIIAPVNDPPVLASIGNQSSTQGSPFSMMILANDPENDNLTFTQIGLPTGLGLNPVSGLISGTTTAAPGTYQVTITVTDDGSPNLSDSELLSWTVLPPNQAPVIASILDQINELATAGNLAVQATDPDGDQLSYQASGLPAGLSISPTTGVISGLISALEGVYPVSITVADDGIGNLSASTSFNWIITSPPVAGGALVRINSGGNNITTPSIPWEVDLQSNPSPYVDGSNNQTTGWYGNFANNGGTNTTIAPDSLFGTFRLDASWSGDPGIRYNIPMDNGSYVVSLFFGEYNDNVVGLRFFDVFLENALVMDDYDIVGEDGFLVAVEKQFNVDVLDGVLNIELQRVPGGDYPKINGVQIAAIGNSNNAPTLSAIPAQNNYQGEVVSLQAVASDIDGNNLSFSATGLPGGLSINPSTGEISGTIDANLPPGIYPCTVQVVDDGTPAASDSKSFNWTITLPPNLAPGIDPIAAQQHEQGEVISLQVNATDPEGDNISFSATGLPLGLNIAPLTGLISGTISATPGTYPVTITATDNGNPIASSDLSFIWTVTLPNQAPVIDAPGTLVSEIGEAVSQQFTAQDYENGTLTWEVDNLPDGLSMNASGLVTGTVSAAASTFTVTLRVADDGVPILRDTLDFDWNIIVPPPNIPPVIDPIAGQTNYTGEAVNLSITFNDPDGDNITLSQTGLPTGLNLSQQGVISGTITAPIGTYSVTITASDDGTPINESTSVSFDWNVTAPPPNLAPVFAPLADRSIGEGQTLNIQFIATDPEGDNLSWSATGLPNGLSINPQTGLLQAVMLNGTVGIYPVDITVTDDGTPVRSTTQSFTLTVIENLPPQLGGVLDQIYEEGEQVLLQVPVNDPEGNTPMIQATGLPQGLVLQASTGLIYGNLASPVGTYPVTLTATDGVNNNGVLEETSISFNIIITSPPVAGGPIIRINSGGNAIPAPSLAWSADQQGNPSPYVDGTNNQTTGWYGNFANNGGVNNTTAPDSLFGTFRLDASWAGNPGIRYNIPLDNGTYEVRLYFAEYNDNVPGYRVFDVSLEGVVVLDDYDIVATEGFLVAAEKIFNAEVLDGVLNLELSRIPNSDYPKINGIHIALVGNNNTKPNLGLVADQSTQQTTPASLQLVASDDDGDVLTYNAIGLPEGLAINNSTGLISGTVTDEEGDYPVSVQVVDNGSPAQDTTVSFTWTVLPPPNLPPVLTITGSLEYFEGDQVSMQASATDPDPQDILTFSAVGLPAGLSINPTTGAISGTLTATMGLYESTVTVTDNGPGTLSDSETFNIVIYEVNVLPVLSPINDTSIIEDTFVNIPLIATDPNTGTSLTFSANGLPNGLNVTSPASGTGPGSIVGTLNDARGDYLIEVIVQDDAVVAFGYDTTTFTLSIIEAPNITPVVDPIADLILEQNEQLNLQVVANDPDGDNIAYAATGLPTGIAINPTTGLISGITTAPLADYEVVVTVTDDGTPLIESVSDTFTISVIAPVNDPPALDPIQAPVHTEGDPVSFTISATDPENDNITYGATNLPAGITINPISGLVSGTLQAAANVYTVTFTATDDGTPNLQDALQVSWTIYPPNQAPDWLPVADQTHFIGEAVALTVTAVDPESDDIFYTATGLPAGLTITGASGVISGTVSAAAGIYPVTLTATDNGTPVESSDVSFNWTINIPPNNAPVISNISARTDEGLDVVSQSVSASDSDGDNLSFSATNLPPGISIDSLTGTLSGTLPAAAGVYTVTVTVTDDGIPNLSDATSFIWTVTPYINEKPVLATIPDQTNELAEPISLYVSASDADGDGLIFSGQNLPPGLNIHPLTGEINGIIGGGTGSYQVSVFVSDDGTPSAGDTATFNWTINPTSPPITGDPIIRINAGGVQVPDPPLNWVEDKQNNPVSYFVGTGNSTSGWDDDPRFNTSNGTDAPNKILATYRNDPSWGSPGFGYEFPLDNGYYEVNLFFAEVNESGVGLGGRVFDITIEGVLVEDNLDIFAEVGYDAGLQKTYNVELLDGVLDLDFPRVPGSENALIRGIEIRMTGNSEPVFVMSNQVHEEFETVSVPVNASDPEGHSLTFAATGLPNGLSINPQSGLISGTILDDTVDYAVSITVTDDGSPSASATRNFTWTVLPTPQPNHPPVVTISNQEHEENQAVSVNILAADPDGDQLTFTAVGLPAGLALNSSTGIISGTVSSPAGTYPVTVTVTDNGTPNLSTDRQLDWVIVVPPPNHAPVFNPIADQSSPFGSVVSIFAIATDEDGDQITYSATGLPTGISIDPVSGEMSGTLSASEGTYSVTVTATDNGTPVLSGSEFFNWTVLPSQVAACVSVLEYETDIIFASNFETGSTKIINLAPNGEKIVRVTFDIRDMMYPDFALDDGTALGGNMGTPGHKAPHQDTGSDPVGFNNGTHIYELPHQPFPVLDPSVLVGYQGFTLNFNPSQDGGFEPGEEFHFSWDTDPTNISYVTTNNGPGGGGKTSGFDLMGSKVTIEWDNGTIITKDLWYTSGTVCGSQAYFTSSSIPAPTIEVLGSPQDSMRVDNVNQIVRVTGTPGKQVSLIIGEGGNYAEGNGIPPGGGGYDPDYFEMNNVFAFQEISAFVIGPSGTVDIPITLHRSDLESFNIELPEQHTKHWVIRAALRSEESCTSSPCTAACTSPASNKIYLMYDAEDRNYNPFIAPIADQSNEAGSTINMPVEAFDPEAGVLTCSAVGLPNGLSIDPGTGLISGILNATPGTYNVQITAVDDGFPIRDTSRSFVWTITSSTNANPILTSIGNQTSEEGETVSLALSASDPNGDNILFGATGLPAGLSIDSVSGEISGVVIAIPGAYTVTVTVTDDGSPAKQDVETFIWTIISATNPSPVFVATPDQTNEQNEVVSVTAVANDPNGNSLIYEATGLPGGVSINPSTGEMSGTVTAVPGAYTVSLKVTDNGTPFKFDVDTFLWTIVVPVNDAPVLDPVASQTNFVGEVISVTVSATDPDGDNITYSATGLPNGLSLNPQTGEITGTLQGPQGVYSITVTATDDGSPVLSDLATFSWTVTSPPNQAPDLAEISDQSNFQGDSVTLVASATDPEGDGITYSATGLPGGLSIDPVSGEISGEVNAGVGLYIVTVTATDDGSPNKSVSRTFNWTVGTPPNQAPELTIVSNQNNFLGDVVNLQMTATDANGDNLIFNQLNLPSGLNIQGTTGLITGTITGAPATYAVEIMVSDDGTPSMSDTISFTWTVSEIPNETPVIAAIADQTSTLGDNANLQIVATDADAGDVLSYVANNLPTGLSINPSTGLIDGSIGGSPNTYNVQIIVSDDRTPPAADTTFFTWTVNDIPNTNPVVVPIANQTDTVGNAISFQVIASDADAGDILTYAASNLPNGLNINNSTGLISGTVAGPANVYAVEVIVTDDRIPAGADTTTFSWTIDPEPNVAPVIDLLADQIDGIGATVSVQIVANDANAADVLSFAASNLPTGLSINSATGLISGTIGGSDGLFNVEVIVSDDGSPSLSDTLTFDWTVTPVPNSAPTISSIADQNNNAGDNVSIAVSATDPNGGDALSYSANNLPTGISINFQTGQISGQVGAPGGTYNVSVIVVDDGVPSMSDTANFTWTVVLPPNDAPVIDLIADQTNDDGDAISLTATATDPNGDGLSFSAINLPPQLSINANTGEITGTASNQAGTYNVSVIVTDDAFDSKSDTANFVWEIEVANQAPVITAIPNQSTIQGTADSLQVNATDPEGHTISYMASGLPTGLSMNIVTGKISGTVTAAPGSYNVVVVVIDNGSPAASSGINFSWVVTAPNSRMMSPDEDPLAEVELKNISAVFYPNPVANKLHIELDEDPMVPYTIIISDTKGKLLFNEDDLEGKGQSIDVAHLSEGLYIVRVLVPGRGFSVKQILKN